MTQVFPLKYCGGGMFQCLRPSALMVQPGEVHGWAMMEHRSSKSHAHWFALVHEAWCNLPESMGDEYPSSEHFRKAMLILAGFCTDTRIACASNSEAVRLVAQTREMDPFALVGIDDKIVRIRRAKSQAKGAMGKAEFQEAKEKALHVMSEILGTDAATLGRQAA